MPVLDIHTGFPTPPSTSCVNLSAPATNSSFGNSVRSTFRCSGNSECPSAQGGSVKVGFSVFNLFNHFNPRDVQNDLDSQRFVTSSTDRRARSEGSLFSGSSQEQMLLPKKVTMEKVNQCLILAPVTGRVSGRCRQGCPSHS